MGDTLKRDLIIKDGQIVTYHYTSLENWASIKECGLYPYDIQKNEVRHLFNGGIMRGIWLWTQDLQGMSHFGSIIFQMASKGASRIVKLRVVCDPEKRLQTPDGKHFFLYHQGNISVGEGVGFVYHDGSEEAIIYGEHIPAKDIDLIAAYDLQGLVEKHDKKRKTLADVRK